MGLDNPLHVVLLLLVLLLVFGAKKLPEIGRSLGTGLREFKQSISGESHGPTLTAGVQHAPAAQPAAQAPAEQQVQPQQTPPAA